MFIQSNLFPLESAETAVFSSCRSYRYTLWRIWNDGSRCVQFIGLNPSTADEFTNDPTLRRCINFAKEWGFDSMCMTNLFAYRATDPKIMKNAAEPIGDDNDKWLVEISNKAELIIAAWGNHGKFLNRNRTVCEMLKGRLFCLAQSGKGNPKHPLYLPSNLSPRFFY